MPVDTSIYQSIQPVKPVETPSIMDTAQKAMTLSGLAMQQQQAQLGMQQQMALRQAYAHNVDENGNLNQSGVLSDLNRGGFAHLTPQVSEEIAKSNKAAAEAHIAKLQDLHQTVSAGLPYVKYALTLPEEKAKELWPNFYKEMEQKGLTTPNMLPYWDRDHVAQADYIGSHYKEALENQLTEAGIGAKQAEARLAPVKLNSELYGSRSPNAELSSQYNKDVAPIRNSQLFMEQMLDSYKNKTPQGDAALVLNNFKIRNPAAVDVNSIEEMKSSQSVSDAWKNKINQALNGGFDDATRKNLIRDGISAYRANYNTYQGIKKRYDERARLQNVNDPTLTHEPGMEKTYQDSMALQKEVGPFVPPTERPGMMGSAKKIVAGLIGAGEEKSAQAAPTGDESKKQNQPKYRAPGATVTGEELAKYATQNKMKLEDAREYLKGHGYVIGR